MHTDDTPDLFGLPPAPPEPPAPPPWEGPVFSLDGDTGVPLHRFAEQAYLTYAMSTVLERALPFVEDGQKPVQRRILYAMRELGNRADAPFKKSARIVGDVIGKYHPHGDSAVYEAAVRMAQEFSLRYPLIEGQGNFGSRDGDAAAAMRYTEVRLSRFAEDILLAEIDRGTVDFRENYDGTLREPVLLPARLPVLMLNGVSGIAVGMATEIAPHNLGEVAEACIAIIQGKGDEAVHVAIPGPDFPGGAQIISAPEDIRRAYDGGRGSLRVRARWTVEPLARGQYRVAVTELPPGTNSARILAEIEELINPKPRAGKKSLSNEQQTLRNAVLGVLDTFRDDSDKAHPVRIVLEPRSRTVAPDDLMNLLLANTSLEGNVALNMTMIGRDGRPRQKTLVQTLREWCDFRMVVVERRLRFRHDEVARRMHILEGRMIAFLRIEEVIRVIREADAPKAELMAVFGLTEVQAEDILEIRLRQLARLEGIRIEKELAELRSEAGSLRELLDSEAARRRLIVREIRDDARRYGDPRRTLIEAAEKVTAAKVDTVTDEPVTVILSRNGFLRSRAGHGVDRAMLSWKDGDGELAIIETRSVHPVVLLDTQGRTYTVRAADLPGGKGDGVPASSLVDLQGARPVAMLSGAAELRVLLATSVGVGFVGRLGDMVSRVRTGKSYMAVDAGATLLPPVVVDPQARFVAVLAAEPRLLIFPLDEMRELSGGKGVQLIALKPGESLLAARPVGEAGVILTGVGRGDKEVTFQVSAQSAVSYLGKRARKGKPLPLRWKKYLTLQSA